MNRHERRIAKKQASQKNQGTSQLDYLIAQAQQYEQAKEFNLAEDAYRTILKLKPEFAAAYNNLGYVLERQNEIEEAVACYQQAIQINPELAEAHFSLGNIFDHSGQFDKALRCYEEALKYKPTYVKALFGTAHIFNKKGQFAKAADYYMRTLALEPNLADAHYFLGNMLQLQDDAAVLAAEHYERAVNIDPNMEGAHHNLGNYFQHQGVFDRASSHYRKALDIKPDFAEAHYSRALTKTFKSEDTDLASLEALALKVDQYPSSKRKYIHFALARALQDIKEFQRAFEHSLKANTLKRSETDYNESATLSEFQEIADTFTRDILNKSFGIESSLMKPIFIVGMPRSGTTLIEQILASHPLVFGAGELDNLRQVANNVFNSNGKHIHYPKYITTLDGAGFRKLGQAYLNSLPKLSDKKIYITDKMPRNFQYVGLIRLILPNAKIIHTMRDPVDTCVSCFMTLFRGEQNFSYNLAELGRYYRAYEKLMDHWRSILPPRVMLDFSYEKLIDDFEPQVRKLLDYCGLPWDERCLAFHKTSRTITTASATQVRQPIYRTSLQRWKKYEAYLGPLLSELGLPHSS